jgi:UrcA family protein
MGQQRQGMCRIPQSGAVAVKDSPEPPTLCGRDRRSPEAFMTLQRIASRWIGSAILLGVALCAGGFLSVAIAAEPEPDHVELKVTAWGLNLGTPEGAATFLDRLTVAAKNACGGQGDLNQIAAYKRCYNQAIFNAVRTVNQPRLIQAYVTRYPNEAAQFGMKDDHPPEVSHSEAGHSEASHSEASHTEVSQ